MLDNYPETKKIAEESIFIGSCIVTAARPIIISEKDMGDDYDPWTTLPSVNFILHNIERDSWGYHSFNANGFKFPKATHAEKEGEMIVVGTRGEVWYHGLGENKRFEKNIPKEYTNRPVNIKNIHGVVYVVGNFRAVLRRNAPNQWTLISKPIRDLSFQNYHLAQQKGGRFNPGFDCIDGFEADKSLYAAGGMSDVWHYDGENWHAIDIPLAKMHIKAICCASDGYVYIAGRYGALLKGRGDEWEIIETKGEKQDFKDIADYNGKVYICTKYDFYTVERNGLKAVNLGELSKPLFMKSLYANHGLLMLTGASTALLYNGKEWEILYSGNKDKEIKDFNALVHITEQLDDAVDKLGQAAKLIKKGQ